jgi:hypothetical protein
MNPDESLACAIGFREMASPGRMDWEEMQWVDD